MATVLDTFYGDAADNYVQSSNATYSTMRTGSNLVISLASGNDHVIGQYLNIDYFGFETFLKFDTSSIPDGAVISKVQLFLYGETDASDTDFTMEVRVKDWGATVTTADWVAGGSLSALTRVATFATSGFSTSGLNEFTEDGTNFQSAINKTGVSYFVVVSSRFVAGTTPSANEHVFVYSQDKGTTFRPRLDVTYTGPATVTAITPAVGTVDGGQAVTITGTNFDVSTPTVTIKGVSATSIVVVGPTSLTCVTGAGTAGVGDVVVTVTSGAGTLSSGFTYTDVVDSTLRLVKAGAFVGDNKAVATQWPNSDGSLAYGGANDMWGTSWTPAEINATDFGVGLSALVATGSPAAKVDTITMTVYYTVPGVSDPTPLMVAMEVDADRVTVTPYVYQLPRAGLTVANDPGVVKATSNVEIRTSRYFRPQRNVPKVFEEAEAWVELDPQSNTPGFEIWASVDGGTDFQLVDANGDVATFLTTGAAHVWFPKTSSAIGHYAQLIGKVPSKTGGEVDVAVSFRDLVMRGTWTPSRTETIEAIFVLGGGEFSDRASMRRTPEAQKNLLESLAGENNTTPIPYKDIYGNSGYVTIQSVSFREVEHKGVSVMGASVRMRTIPID